MIFLLVVWLLASLFITHLWIGHHEVFPSLPSAFWSWADSYYQSTNADEVADLEFIVLFSVSAASMLVGLSFFYILWRQLRLLS
jgi:hypothetical protein